MTRAEKTAAEIARGAEVVARKTRLAKLEAWEKEGNVRIIWGHPEFSPNSVAVYVCLPPEHSEYWHVEHVNMFPSEELMAKVYLELEFGAPK